VLAEARVAAVILAAGVLLGVAWALIAPALSRSADLGESRVAVDGLLGLLGVGAGVVTAIVLVLAPGPWPPLRLAVVLAAVTVANILAAVVGLRLGVRVLGAPGVAVLWPLVAAVLTALRMLAGLVVFPDGEGSRPSARHAGAVPSEEDGAGDVSEPREP
jgi:choline-glycine betaine transporter